MKGVVAEPVDEKGQQGEEATLKRGANAPQYPGSFDVGSCGEVASARRLSSSLSLAERVLDDVLNGTFEQNELESALIDETNGTNAHEGRSSASFSDQLPTRERRLET
jgi:hypothetical protein